MITQPNTEYPIKRIIFLKKIKKA